MKARVSQRRKAPGGGGGGAAPPAIGPTPPKGIGALTIIDARPPPIGGATPLGSASDGLAAMPDGAGGGAKEVTGPTM